MARDGVAILAAQPNIPLSSSDQASSFRLTQGHDNPEKPINRESINGGQIGYRTFWQRTRGAAHRGSGFARGRRPVHRRRVPAGAACISASCARPTPMRGSSRSMPPRRGHSRGGRHIDRRRSASAGVKPQPSLPSFKRPDGSAGATPLRPALAQGRVRFVGEAVAAVIAETRGAGQGCARRHRGRVRGTACRDQIWPRRWPPMPRRSGRRPPAISSPR